MTALAPPLLEVRDLIVEFGTKAGVLRGVDGVSLQVRAGEILAVVGETGCGKTVTAQAIMGILDLPPASIIGGSVCYRGLELLGLPESKRRLLRGREIAMIFQDPLTALDPVFRVGDQVAEMFTTHLGLSRKRAWGRAEQMLARVGLPDPASLARRYPHELSGGMRQRVVIAIALALGPQLLIADEPTTALDVSIQAQIIELLAGARDETGMSIVLITHDLGLVAELADRVVVMYAGRVVETGDIAELYARPAHPYTAALIAAVPRVDVKGGLLAAIPGAPPDGLAVPPGCPFHPRCERARPVCSTVAPPPYRFGDGRASACHFYEEVLGADRSH